MSNGTDNFPKMPPYPAKPAIAPSASAASVDDGLVPLSVDGKSVWIDGIGDVALRQAQEPAHEAWTVYYDNLGMQPYTSGYMTPWKMYGSKEEAYENFAECSTPSNYMPRKVYIYDKPMHGSAQPMAVPNGEIPTALQRWESRNMATQKHWSIGEFRQAEIDALRTAPAAQAHIIDLGDSQIEEIYRTAFNGAPGAARSAPKPPPLVVAFARAVINAVRGGSKQLTDEQIVEALHSVGIDTHPSKNGFNVEQIEGMSITTLRQAIAAISAKAAS